MLPYVVHGEISTDGHSIVLVAGGYWDDAIAHAAKLMRTLTPLVTDTKLGALTVPLTWVSAVQLAQTYESAWRPGPRLTRWITTEYIRRTTPQPLDLPPLPAGLTPQPWQLDGAEIITRLGNTLIWDEPRTGKAITTILGLLARSALTQVTPVVIICPASVVDEWADRWHEWAPDWNVSTTLYLIDPADVHILGYENARDHVATLLKLDPATVVIDESHYICNGNAKRSRATRRISAGRTVIQTSGTPIKKDSGDYWAVLNAQDPLSWPSKERYVKRFCQTVQGNYEEEIVGLQREAELHLCLLGQERRQSRGPEFSRKQHQIYTVQLPPAYRKAYDELEDKMIAELPDGDELTVMHVIALQRHLTSLASSACEVEITYELDKKTGEEKAHYHLRPRLPSWKVDALLHILPQHRGTPVSCWTPSRQLAQLAGQQAEEAGYKVGYILGQQTRAKRTAARRAFQAGELDLLCATTGSGGTGLTLNAGPVAVFLSRPQSLVESIQSEDRPIGFAGSNPDVTIIDIVTENTTDTRDRAGLREKAGQLGALVRDPRISAELLGGSNVIRIDTRKAG